MAPARCILDTSKAKSQRAFVNAREVGNFAPERIPESVAQRPSASLRSRWGLSDGGYERFWSDLRKLIPGLRVTGTTHLHPMDRLEVVIPSPAHRALHRQAWVTQHREFIARNESGLSYLFVYCDGSQSVRNGVVRWMGRWDQATLRRGPFALQQGRSIETVVGQVGQAQCSQEFGIHVGRLLGNRIGIDVVVKWCPAHSGVVGNERADEIAKIWAL
ncbi:uncharacterized protein EI90DRAFT_3025053 [Cantharellus anzutake]|uniref:uncharacterized protein n=1 Tax=Cantharellus anzutake TaxID=1750568 RepID=UPI001903DCFE|nr:uncharacterized protein EI90DRAFT_3025053 [Cantharellus anzutake]KAF8309604.1 hypothetical protein EI90DRAFT_3025053 [Cantharellus anzutake]